MLLISGCATEEDVWEKAKEIDTIESYEEYIEKYPNGYYAEEASWRLAINTNSIESYKEYLQEYSEGEYTKEAEKIIEDLIWGNALNTNSIESYKEYLQEYSEGEYAEEAEKIIEDLIWESATEINTIRTYNLYCETYPEGYYIQQAEENVARLQSDDAPYEDAIDLGTEKALNEFLIDYHGHNKEAVVQKILQEITEGRDIVDLINENKISAKVKGNGITSVLVELIKHVPYDITVRIPVGTFFVSSASSIQNMVTVSQKTVQITVDVDVPLDALIDAACANMHRDIPDSDDTFTVRRSPHQAELTKLMPILDEANVDSNTRQAAVWIITDNATYDNLGILVLSRFGVGGSRAINEQEAAKAMMIIDEAGINIKGKRIWRDRDLIISGLEDGNLKSWLQNK